MAKELGTSPSLSVWRYFVPSRWAGAPREKTARELYAEARLRREVFKATLARERRASAAHAVVFLTFLGCLLLVDKPMALFVALLSRLISLVLTKLALLQFGNALRDDANLEESLSHVSAAQVLAGITWAGLLAALDPVKDPPLVWIAGGGAAVMGASFVLVTLAPISRVMICMAGGFFLTLLLSTMLDPSPLPLGYIVGAVPIVLGGMLLGASLAKQSLHEVEMAIENTSLNAKLQRSLERAEQLLQRDPMTGLYNRRFVFSEFRTPPSLDDVRTMIQIDVDDMRAINDRFGHDTGDAILRAIAREMEHACTMLPDGRYFCARLSGEEFVIILDQIDMHEGLEIAKDLLIRTRAVPSEADANRGLAVTTSISVVEQRPREPLSTLVKRSEDALRRAKALGGNILAPPI